MFLEGYRVLTDDELSKRLSIYEGMADKLNLVGDQREEFMNNMRAELDKEKVHVKPVLNVPKKI